MSQGWRQFPFATVARAVDGDTVEVLIDQGFDALRRVRVRLFGIDCPERKGATRQWGEVARDFASTVAAGRACTLWTARPSFDRYEGFVLVDDDLDLRHAMVTAGFALPWDYPVEPKPAWTAFPAPAALDSTTLYELLVLRRIAEVEDIRGSLPWAV